MILRGDQQGDDVGEGPADRLGRGGQDRDRPLVTRAWQPWRRAAASILDRSAVSEDFQRPGLPDFGEQDLRGRTDRPARRDVFEPSWLWMEIIDPEMADLGGAGPRSRVDLAVEDQTATDPAADRHIEQRREPDARSVTGFTEASGIRIVLDGDIGDLQGPPCPIGQFKIVPARNLVRFQNPTARGVDGTAEPEPHGRRTVEADRCPGKQGFVGLGDLLENALGTRLGLDRSPFECEDSPVSPAEAKLELGPTNLHAQKQFLCHHRQRVEAATGSGYGRGRCRRRSDD